MTSLDQLQLVKLADICHKNELVTIASDSTVADAVKLMKEKDLTTLPVTKEGHFVGIVDIRAVTFFLAWGKYKARDLSNVQKPFHDPSVNYGGHKISDLLEVGTEAGRVWTFDGKDPVQSVIEPFSKGVHRAIVTVDGHKRLLTQTDVAKWIASNHAFGKVLDKTLEALGLTKGNVVSINDTDSALEGFRKATQNEVSAVAILDPKNGRIVGALSGSDLRGLDVNSVKAVEQPVTEFLAATHPSSLNPIVVHRGDTLRYVLNKMLALKVHRVFCIDVAHKPTAVLALGDIIGKFSLFSPEMQA